MIGIYCITNTVNGKRYIGQSWNIERRWYEHKNSKRNDHLRLAFNKYGIDAFDFSILRKFGNSGLTQIFLDTFERKYIIEMKTYDRTYGYNKNTGGGSASIVNDEVKEKISKSNTGKKRSQEVIEKYRRATIDHYKKYGSHCTGIPKSAETKAKISKALVGSKWSEERRKLYVCTEETKEKMRNSHLGIGLSENHRLNIIKARASMSEEKINEMKRKMKLHSKGMSGQKHSEITKIKISITKAFSKIEWVKI